MGEVRKDDDRDATEGRAIQASASYLTARSDEPQHPAPNRTSA